MATNQNNGGWVHDPEAGVDVRLGGRAPRPRQGDGSTGDDVYDWGDDAAAFAPPRPTTPPRQEPTGSGRGARAASAAGAAAGGFVGGLGSSFVPPVNVNVNRGGNGGGRGGNGGAAAGGAAGDRHQGDRLIHLVERIEIRSDKDILALAKGINHLGRELHLILGMRAEEINGVLSTYKGKWYTFGASSRVKARLVSAHLKVSAEAAKALGVGALKMAHAFDRHFVKPEQEAKAKRNGKTARSQFTIGEG
ncbi:hypothetical protein KBZ94_41535 [Streptomyces sp. RM72]|uniref:hypothetical protein n=1 Tax=Streptomyces sp. RM72 TaxID=1115510 RepID=UPI001B37F646|nr:hypothetical protein [Streptomyces sp. RM72]MBQ0891316.1 hypothetical protein [Streptomyces sp. RM72]